MEYPILLQSMNTLWFIQQTVFVRLVERDQNIFDIKIPLSFASQKTATISMCGPLQYSLLQTRWLKAKVYLIALIIFLLFIWFSKINFNFLDLDQSDLKINILALEILWPF